MLTRRMCVLTEKTNIGAIELRKTPTRIIYQYVHMCLILDSTSLYFISFSSGPSYLS